ncbi:PH domain-containing protein [Monashia sp. NPDC004114]
MTDRAPAADDETGWRRLDPRMLLIHPLETLVRLLPALLAIFIARLGSDGNDRWELLALPVIVAYGVFRWLTTRYRIGDGQIELRRGLLTKQTTTARLDKVRTVDLTAKLHHRVLGLAKVEISTGGSRRDRLVLDSLQADEGRRLRAELLHRIDPAVTALPKPSGPPVDDAGIAEVLADAPPPPLDEELVRLDPTWVRYAPLTMTGIATAAAGLGFITQGFSRLGEEGQAIIERAQWVRSLAWWIDAVLVLALVSALAVTAYILAFWGFRLTRNRLGSLHTTRGLLTSRETSIDHGRVRGIRLDEPLGLRLAGARRLKVVTTGLLRERGGSDWLCPPAPASVVTGVAFEVVPDAAAILAAPAQHGPAARRRRLIRSIVPAAMVVALLVLLRLVWDLPLLWVGIGPVLLVAAVWVGLDRYTGLGHLVTEGHLVAREGSLDRRRVVLDRDGIIGWTVRRSFFQRRSGLATLVATTAAGDQHYDVVDVPVDRAVAVIAEISPDLLAEFA